MKIAAAQTKPFDGNIEANLADHYLVAKLAVENGARFIVFPEMSLTGYQMELADEPSFIRNDSRLNELKNLSVSKNIVIAAGAPIKINSKLHIGLFILQPNGETLIYTKQFLHAGEDKFFKPSFNFNPQFDLDGRKISLAICADIANPQHAANASKSGTSLYVASIFYTPDGISKCHQQLGNYARKYSMNILMTNFVGTSYKFEVAGRSAFWSNTGEKILQLGRFDKSVLLINLERNKFVGQTLSDIVSHE